MVKYDDLIEELTSTYPIEKQVSFSEIDISDKLAENSKLLVIYQQLLDKERAEMDVLLSLKDKIMGEQYDYYRFNYDKELKPSEIERYYLPKDQKVIKINQLLQVQQWKVNFFSMCVKAIEKCQWNMKGFLDSLKI